MNCARKRRRSSALLRHLLDLRCVHKRVYRVAQKGLHTAPLLFNIECEMDFASLCISDFVAVLILLIYSYVALGMSRSLVVAVRFQAESQFFSSPP